MTSGTGFRYETLKLFILKGSAVCIWRTKTDEHFEKVIKIGNESQKQDVDFWPAVVRTHFKEICTAFSMLGYQLKRSSLSPNYDFMWNAARFARIFVSRASGEMQLASLRSLSENQEKRSSLCHSQDSKWIITRFLIVQYRALGEIQLSLFVRSIESQNKLLVHVQTRSSN